MIPGICLLSNLAKFKKIGFNIIETNSSSLEIFKTILSLLSWSFEELSNVSKKKLSSNNFLLSFIKEIPLNSIEKEELITLLSLLILLKKLFFKLESIVSK